MGPGHASNTFFLKNLHHLIQIKFPAGRKATGHTNQADYFFLYKIRTVQVGIFVWPRFQQTGEISQKTDRNNGDGIVRLRCEYFSIQIERIFCLPVSSGSYGDTG